MANRLQRGFGFQWHITDRCNLRCAHCYQEDFTPQSERPLADLKELADRIFGRLSVRPVSVSLTGGEPLLVPHLFDLVDHLHGFSNLREIHLITNGTAASKAVLDPIRRFPKIRTLKVSIESGRKEVNDSIRGAGNLAKVGTHLPVYRERTGKDIVLMITLSGYNLGTIPETIQFAQEHGAKGIIFERFVPLGQGRGLSDQVLSPAEWKQAMVAIARAAGLEADPWGLLGHHAFWLRPGGRQELLGALCNLGPDTMALMPNGTVYPCRRLPVPVGNALYEAFGRILDRLGHFRIPALRSRLHGELCGLCGLEDCAGCRALALALNNDLLADDPLCPLMAGGDRYG